MVSDVCLLNDCILHCRATGLLILCLIVLGRSSCDSDAVRLLRKP